MGILDKIFKNTKEKKLFVSAIIPAAGSGTRMGNFGDKGKLFLEIANVPVLAHTLAAFQESSLINEIVIATRDCDMLDISDIVKDFAFTKVTKIVSGGSTRQFSVREGLLEANKEADYVVIHDGARPLIKTEEIDSVINEAIKSGAAALGAKVKDTIKKVSSDGIIQNTINRDGLVAIQTPQAFEINKFKRAIEDAVSCGVDFTDDCQLFERLSIPVTVVYGGECNIKITTPGDVAIAKSILEEDFYFWSEI